MCQRATVDEDEDEEESDDEEEDEEDEEVEEGEAKAEGSKTELPSAAGAEAGSARWGAHPNAPSGTCPPFSFRKYTQYVELRNSSSQ